MFRQSMRDAQVYIAHVMFFSLATIFISLVYLKTRDRTIDYAVERTVQLGWFLAIHSLLTIVNVYQSFIECKIMSHEVRLGFYHPLSYVIARCLIEMPFMVLLSLSALVIGGFALGGLNGYAFWSMTMTYASMLYAFEALAQVCSTIFSDVHLNLLLCILLWFGSFLFSEIWVAKEDVIMASRPLFYSSPFHLSLGAFAFLDFHGIAFSCGDDISLLQIGESNSCKGKYDGDAMLVAIGAVAFPTFASDINTMGCFVMTVSIAIAMKCVYALIISYQASLSAEPRKKKNKSPISSKNTKHFVVISGIGSLVFLASMSALIVSNNERTYINPRTCISEFRDLGFRLDAFTKGAILMKILQ